MRRFNSPILTLLAVLLVPFVLAACGGGVPGNAVAVVDGESIEKRDFDAWMQVAARAGGQAETTIPKPPEFTECVAAKRKALPKAREGQQQPTADDLRQQCRQEYEAMRDTVMQQLINAEWIEREARQQNIEVSDREVRQEFENQKDQQFQRESQYKRFLRESGWTEEQLLAQVRTALLARKITEKITAGQDEVTNRQIQQYYENNRARFASPETRDARIVLARTRERAEAARDALEDGDSWRSVARRYSIDEASRAQGGRLQGVTRGSQDAGLEKALFDAKVGDIVGPVRTSLGYYVLEVEDVTKASQQSLEESRATIREALVQQQDQEALQKFEEAYIKEWREKTECREGYEVPQLCGNVELPEESPTPTAPAASPQATATATPTAGEE